MEIKADYENEYITWEFNNAEHRYDAPGMLNAELRGNMIFIEINNGDDYDYRYINLNGIDVLWYSDGSDTVILFQDNGKTRKEMTFKSLQDIEISGSDVCIMTPYEIIVIDRWRGEKQRLYAPFNYSFYYFSSIEGESITVICRCLGESPDSYGRGDWRFSYDPENGWQQLNIAPW